MTQSRYRQALGRILSCSKPSLRRSGPRPASAGPTARRSGATRAAGRPASYASGRTSVTNASTSSGVGGRPSQVERDASNQDAPVRLGGRGEILCGQRMVNKGIDRMSGSLGEVRDHQRPQRPPVPPRPGGGGEPIGVDRVGTPFRARSIHAFKMVRSASGRGCFGGISSSAIRCHNKLSAGLPGTTAGPFFTPGRQTLCPPEVELALGIRPGMTIQAPRHQDGSDGLIKIDRFRRGSDPAMATAAMETAINGRIRKSTDGGTLLYCGKPNGTTGQPSPSIRTIPNTFIDFNILPLVLRAICNTSCRQRYARYGTRTRCRRTARQR